MAAVMGLIKMASEMRRDFEFPRTHVYPKTRRTPRPQPEQCSLEHCPDKAQSHELCRRHLGRLQRHGDPMACVRRPGKRCSCDRCLQAQMIVDSMIFETARTQTAIAATLHSIVSCKHHGEKNRVDFDTCPRKEVWMGHAQHILTDVMPTWVSEMAPTVRADERKAFLA